MSDRLAIDGGKPVRDSLLPYGRQAVSEEDIARVSEVLRSDWLTTGPEVTAFEEAFATLTGAAHAVAFNSGTAALHGAAYAAGLSPGDEAVTTPMTFCATANSIVYQGATPVFADVEDTTLNLDPQRVAAVVTPETRAIFAVDFVGHPAELDALLALADQHDLVLVEDASHSVGGRYRGRPVGSIAHMTTFSFHPVKHIACGEGGMVTTESDELADRLRRFRNHGLTADLHERQSKGGWIYDMEEPGYNYRLSDIACALGRSQLERLPQNLARRRQIVDQYQAALDAFPGVRTPEEYDHVESAWHIYPIRLKLEGLTCDRARVFQALRAENIGVNVHYIPVHQLSYYRERFGLTPGDYPVASDGYERMITLPLFQTMSDEDAADVIEAVQKVVSHYSDR